MHVALRRFQLSAASAVIVGDGDTDIEAGKRAGVMTCGVTYGFAPHTLCEAPPDVMVDSPRELQEMFRT